MTDDSHLPPQDVLDAYALVAESCTPLTGGLINRTFAVARRDGQACVLQRVNPIFPAAIHHDIEAVTRHLQAGGVTSPLLLPTADGRAWYAANDEVWRLLTRIEGTTHETVTSPGMAYEAGRVLGAFHAALVDYDQPLATTRPGVHDILRHIAHLERTLAARQAHPAYGDIAELATRIIRFAGSLPALPEMPSRLVHGDPKISNVIFRGDRAVCLVDLDTITRQSVALELGDALRSWCNPQAEDSPAAWFSGERYTAALAGYRESAAALLDPATDAAIADATLLIAVELAARFAADALNESYFGWDRQRFASASAHNRARAGAQLQLAESMRAVFRDGRGGTVTEP